MYCPRCKSKVSDSALRCASCGMKLKMHCPKCNSNNITKTIFDRLLYNMSYDDVINAITPQSFEHIMQHYQTEYKEE